MSTEIIGLNAKGYYSATALDGTNSATVSWVEMTNISDVTISLTAETVDATTRGSGGVRKNVSTLKDCEVSFTIDADSSVAWWTVLRDGFLNRTQVAMAFCDGDETSAGADGPAGNFTISGFNRNEPLAGVLTYEVTAVIHSDFEWYTSA